MCTIGKTHQTKPKFSCGKASWCLREKSEDAEKEVERTAFSKDNEPMFIS